MSTNNRPGQLKFYKSLGAAQFAPLPPRHDPEKGYMTKEGGILCEGRTWGWFPRCSRLGLDPKDHVQYLRGRHYGHE